MGSQRGEARTDRGESFLKKPGSSRGRRDTSNPQYSTIVLWIGPINRRSPVHSRIPSPFLRRRMSQATELAQLREKVLRLAREIEALSEADVPPEAFFREFLTRLTSAVGARGAAVWLSDGGPLRLAHQIGLEDAGFYSAPQAAQQNDVLLREALMTGETKAYLPDESELPTRHMYVVAPLSVAAEPVGVVEVLQRPETAAQRQSRPVAVHRADGWLCVALSDATARREGTRRRRSEGKRSRC